MKDQSGDPMSRYAPPPYIIRRRATNKAASMLFLVLWAVGAIAVGVGVLIHVGGHICS